MVRGIPEPPPVETDDELEATIKTLIERKDAARDGSAEHRTILRRLKGMRKSSQLAGLIMEEYDMAGISVP